MSCQAMLVTKGGTDLGLRLRAGHMGKIWPLFRI
jgi:hypothetical protein